VNKPETYQYEPHCAVAYDGLYCDGPCAECDRVAAQRALDRADDMERAQ
jgi:hypothetical protein